MWLLSLLLVNAFAQTSGLQNEDFKSLADMKASVATITGNLASSSPCIASPSSLASLAIGQFVYDATLPARITAGTVITAIPGTCPAGQVQMSLNSASSATGDTVTFGGQPSQLLNGSKIWIASLSDQLSNLFTNNNILTNNNSVSVTGKTMSASLNTFSGITASSLSSGAATFGQVATADGSGNVGWSTPAGTLSSSYDAKNYTVITSVGTNALTIALKTLAGTDPTSLDPVKVSFASSFSGDYTAISITSALSITVPSGTTLGCASNFTCDLYIYLINDAGTPYLAVSTSYWTEGKSHSVSAVSGGASSAVLYGTSSHTAISARLIALGPALEATAGTWATNLASLQLLPIVNMSSELYAGLQQPSGTGAGCDLSTASGSIADIPANAACTGHVYTGTYTSVLTQDYRLRVTGLKPGKYVATGMLPLAADTGVATACEAYFDSTTIGNFGYGQASQANSTANGPNYSWNYTGWQVTSTYQAQTDFYWRWRRIVGSGNCRLLFNSAGVSMMMSVIHYPLVDGQ